MQELNYMYFTGTQINYYFICQRKLWYFSKYIPMEDNSDNVLIGKTLHKDAYSRNKKEILIDDKIAIDFMEKEGIINEIKKSNKMEKAHIFQMLYYLYYLESKGLKDLKGVINYPLLKKREEVFLTNDNRKEILNVLENIRKIVSLEKPPQLEKKSSCRSCSYYELCWV